MKKILATSAILILAATSCTPKKNVVNEPVKSTAAEIAQGKTIFENACKRCHDLPEPTKYTSVQWVGIMNSMAPKARLNEEQHRWVYDYVVSVK